MTEDGSSSGKRVIERRVPVSNFCTSIETLFGIPKHDRSRKSKAGELEKGKRPTVPFGWPDKDHRFVYTR